MPHLFATPSLRYSSRPAETLTGFQVRARVNSSSRMPKAVNKPARTKPGVIDWKLIDGLYLQGLLPEAISERTGVNSRTIAVSLSRRGITKERDLTLAKQREEGRSDRLREKLGEIAESTADSLLAKAPSTPEDLNLHADTAQKVAKTASLLYGWGEGAQVAIIMPGVLTGKPEQDAIEVESAVEPD